MRNFLPLPFLTLLACTSRDEPPMATNPPLPPNEVITNWTDATTKGEPPPRHEAAFVAIGNKAYLLGGRGIKPVDIYDPATQTWTAGTPSPVETHYIQPIVYQNDNYLRRGGLTFS